jgi:hypothetical protein
VVMAKFSGKMIQLVLSVSLNVGVVSLYVDGFDGCSRMS